MEDSGNGGGDGGLAAGAIAIPGVFARPREEGFLREEDLPAIALPRVPDAAALWSRALIVAWLGLGYFFWGRLT